MLSLMRNGNKDFQKLLLLTSSLISIVLGSIVILGWFTQTPLLIQIKADFVPMQFNTALCFILAGLVFYSLDKNIRIRGINIHIVLSTILFIFASLSFSQYITGQNLGIDELFLEHYIQVKSKFPGRMSPNTATCFIFISLLSFVNLLRIDLRNKLILSLILSSLIISFSATSFISYMLGIDVAFAWQESTRMAVHTSFIFLTLSSTSFYLLMMKLRQRSVYNWLPIPTTLAFLVFFVITAQFIRQNEKQTIDQTIINDAKVVTAKVDALMTEKLKALERLAKRLTFQNGNNESRWSEDAKSYYYDFKYFLQLEVYLNNPPRKWKYPHRAIQENLDQSRIKEILIYNAKKTKSSILSQTVVKNDNKRVAYLASPVIKNNDILGVQIVTIDVETLFDTIFKDIEVDWYDVTVTENDGPIYKSYSKGETQKSISTFLLDTISGSWLISLSPKTRYINLLTSSSPELIVYFGIVVSMFAGLILYNYQNIKIAKQEAQYQEKLKSSILANMSHEIRTPMNGILGMVDILSDEFQDQKVREKVEIIKSSSQALLKTINNILDLTKIEASKFELDIEVFDLTALIKDVVTLYSLEANKKSTKISYKISEGFPELIKADPYRIRQVLNNILSNAVKFTKDGEIDLNLDFNQNDDSTLNIFISISDTGIGIEQSNITNLFQDYEQEYSNTKNEYGGTGLGLAITKRIIELINGKISISSKLNKGTTVAIEFKCDEGQKVEEQKRIFTNTQEQDFKALIVDDSEVNLTILERFLKDLNIKSKKSFNGRDAIEKIKNENFNIIFVDYHMPIMDGAQTAKYIRENYDQSTRPIIVCLTGNTNNEIHEKLKYAGIDEVILKPINKSALRDVVEKYREQLNINDSVKTQDQSILNTLITKEDLLIKFGGDKQLLIESIALLIKSLPTMIEKIEKSYHSNDFKGLELNAHSYRSSMANFHIIPAIRYAEIIEKSAIVKNKESIDTNIRKLKKITIQSEKILNKISFELEQ